MSGRLLWSSKSLGLHVVREWAEKAGSLQCTAREELCIKGSKGG